MREEQEIHNKGVVGWSSKYLSCLLTPRILVENKTGWGS